MAKILFLIIGIIIGVFVVIFIMQNTVTVDVNLMGFNVSMSRAFMLLIVLGVGIVLGWIVKSLAHFKKH